MRTPPIDTKWVNPVIFYSYDLMPDIMERRDIRMNVAANSHDGLASIYYFKLATSSKALVARCSWWRYAPWTGIMTDSVWPSVLKNSVSLYRNAGSRNSISQNDRCLTNDGRLEY
jgi:hypothetical protein